MRKLVLSLCVFGLAASALTGCDRVQEAMYRRAAKQLAQGDRTDWLKDGGLHLVLCGTGSPIADPARAGGCAAIIANGSLFLIDTGPGSWENVQLWRLPRASLKAVLLTHFHSDHIGDLGEVNTQSWIAGRREPLAVYGPEGVNQVVEGFVTAYAFDDNYRVAHHGQEAMPREASQMQAHVVDLPGPTDVATVYEKDGIKITAFAVDHRPVTPAYGYRIDYAGRSVVISGDTMKSPNLAQHAKGADIIVHEALAANLISRISKDLGELGETRLAKLTSDITTYHATPAQAAETAKEAGARMLVLTHLVPAPPNRIVRRLFLEGVDAAWSGPVVLGEDGMLFSLPPNSTKIEQGSLK